MTRLAFNGVIKQLPLHSSLAVRYTASETTSDEFLATSQLIGSATAQSTAPVPRRARDVQGQDRLRHLGAVVVRVTDRDDRLPAVGQRLQAREQVDARHLRGLHHGNQCLGCVGSRRRHRTAGNLHRTAPLRERAVRATTAPDWAARSRWRPNARQPHQRELRRAEDGSGVPPGLGLHQGQALFPRVAQHRARYAGGERQVHPSRAQLELPRPGVAEHGLELRRRQPQARRLQGRPRLHARPPSSTSAPSTTTSRTSYDDSPAGRTADDRNEIYLSAGFGESDGFRVKAYFDYEDDHDRRPVASPATTPRAPSTTPCSPTSATSSRRSVWASTGR